MPMVIGEGTIIVGFEDAGRGAYGLGSSLADIVGAQLEGADEDVQAFVKQTADALEELERNAIAAGEHLKRARDDARRELYRADPNDLAAVLDARNQIDRTDVFQEDILRDMEEGIQALGPDILQAREYIDQYGDANQKAAISQSRLSTGIRYLAASAASGNLEMSALNFVTDTMTQSALGAGEAFKQAGGGVKGFFEGVKQIGSSLKASGTGPMIAIAAAAALVTAGYIAWKKAQEAARKEQQAWNKAVVSGEDAVRTHVENVVKAEIVERNWGAALLQTGLDADSATEAILGNNDALDVLNQRYEELNDELGRFSDTFAFTTEQRDDSEQALHDERDAIEEVRSVIAEEIKEREKAVIIAEAYAVAQRRAAVEAGRTVGIMDDLATGLITSAGALDQFIAAGTNIDRIIELMGLDGSDLIDTVRELGYEFPNTIDGLEGFINQLERSPEFMEENAELLAILKAALKEQEGALNDVEQARLDEEAAALAAEEAKQQAIDDTNAKEQEQIDLINDRIAARLREGDSGLQLIDALERAAEAEVTYNEARNAEDRAQAEQEWVAALIEARALAGDAAGDMVELRGTIQGLADQGLLPQEVADQFIANIDAMNEKIEGFQQSHDDWVTGSIERQDFLKSKIEAGNASAQEAAEFLSELDGGLISQDLELDIVSIIGPDLYALIQGWVKSALRGTGAAPTAGISFISDSGVPIRGFAKGGTIKDGDVGFVGEQGPELAIGRPGGVEIIPLDGGRSQSVTPDSAVAASAGNSIEVNINNSTTNDINKDSQLAGLIIGSAVR